MKRKWRNSLPILWAILLGGIVAIFMLFASERKLQAETVDRNLDDQITDISVRKLDSESPDVEFQNGDVVLVTVKFKPNQAMIGNYTLPINFRRQNDKKNFLHPLQSKGILSDNNKKIGSFVLDDNGGQITFDQLTCFTKGSFTFAAVVRAQKNQHLYLQVGDKYKEISIKAGQNNDLIQKVGTIQEDNIAWDTLINTNKLESNQDYELKESFTAPYLSYWDELQIIGEDSREIKTAKKSPFGFTVDLPRQNRLKNWLQLSYVLPAKIDSKTEIFKNNNQVIKTKMGTAFAPLNLEEEVYFENKDPDTSKNDFNKDDFLQSLFKYFQEKMNSKDDEKKSAKDQDKQLTLKEGQSYVLPSQTKLNDLISSKTDPASSQDTKSAMDLTSAKKQFKDITTTKKIRPKSQNSHLNYSHRHSSNLKDNADDQDNSFNKNEEHHAHHKLPQAGAKNEVCLVLIGCILLTSALLIKFVYKKR